jgi:outer membrane protein assembly factor BamB
VKRILVLLVVLLLAACAGTDNAPKPTPLKPLASKVRVETNWKASVSKADLYHFAPDTTGGVIYAAGIKGMAGFDPSNGHETVRIKTDKELSGGVGAQNGVLVAGTIKGVVYAYSTDGSLKWKARVSSEVITPPALGEGIAVLRSVDGRIWGLDLNDGKVRWQYPRAQPSLILRNYAPVSISDGVVYAGLAGGRIAALSLAEGRVLWDSQIAQAKGASELERVTDVTSTPVADRGEVCAVAYQGKVACFAVNNGSQLWSREISSYAGLAVDKDNVYVTDEDGNVQAFDRSGGRSVWKQAGLYGRHVSTPAVYNGNVVVGDFEGYVHFLSPVDGSFVARQSTDKSSIVAAPRVIANQLVVQTQDGDLYALALK